MELYLHSALYALQVCTGANLTLYCIIKDQDFQTVLNLWGRGHDHDDQASVTFHQLVEESFLSLLEL